MVGITIILAAVIGTFVLDIGSDLEQPPQATVSVSDADATLDGTSQTQDVVVIEHRGGDDLPAEDTSVIVEGSTAVDTSLGTGLSVGESVTLTEDGGDVSSDTTLTVRVVHTPSETLLTDTEVTVQ